MNRNIAHNITATSLLAALLFCGNAWADDAETTIRLMGASEAMGPDAVMNNIMLPATAKIDVAAVRKHEVASAGGNPDVTAANDPRDNANEAADEAKQNREAGGPPEDRGPPGGPPGQQ
jgi:hypothetical protein